MPRLHRTALPILLACLALGCASAAPPDPGAAIDPAVDPASPSTSVPRRVLIREPEYRDFLAGLDSFWIAFGSESVTLTALDRLVLDDLAEILAANPKLRLRLWATAPEDSFSVQQAGDWRGSRSMLARLRTEVVLQHLRERGVPDDQLRMQGAAPRRVPARVDWRQTGGTFVFVAAHAEEMTVPPRFVRVRVRAAPGSEVYFVPLSAVAPDSVSLLCRPPSVTRRGATAADSTLEGSYPPRAIVAVTRDLAGVIRTRRHAVDPANRPDVVDLTREFPDPRCR